VTQQCYTERIAELERRLEEVLRENSALREENARLRKELDEWKRGHRERSKRRSSRPEGRRATERRTPGRQKGHPGAKREVPKPDRRVEYQVPARCDCGGHVEPNGETVSTVVQDVPKVQVENVELVAHVGRCTRCGKRVVSKLPGAVDNGQSIAEVQLGPNAKALVISLRYEYRMPLRGIAAVLGEWFGLWVTASGLCQSIDKWRERSSGSYTEIKSHIRSSGVVGLDETGLRQDGVPGWAWIARTERASLFVIERSRGAWVAEKILGSNFQGVVCTDFYGVYTARDDWQHAYCGGHLVREVKKVAEVEPGMWTEYLRDFVCDWYVEAKIAQQGSPREQRKVIHRLGNFVAARGPWDHPEVQRVAHRIESNFQGIVAFVQDPLIPADNNGSERDIRPLAVFRRVTGGTRSDNGSRSLAHWMSLTQTLRKNNISVRDYVCGLYEAHLAGRSPPSVFAPS
jgi:transposase